MVIQCDKCQTKFRLDDSKITGVGVKVRCTKCQNVFIVRPPGFQETPQETTPPPSSGGQAETPGRTEPPPPSSGGATGGGGFEAPPQPPSSGADTGAGFDAGYGAGAGTGASGTVDFKFGDESQQTQGGYGEFDFSAGQQGDTTHGNGGAAGFDAGQGFQDSFGSGGFEPPSHGTEAPAPKPPESDFGFGNIPPEPAPPQHDFGAGIPREPASPQHDFGFGGIPQEPAVKKGPKPAPAEGGLDKDEFEFKTSDESTTPEQKGVDDIMKGAFGGGMAHPAKAGDAGGEAEAKKGSTETLEESLHKEDTKIHAKEAVKEKKTATAKPAKEGMAAIIAAIIIIIAAAAVYFTGAVQTVKNTLSPPPPAVKAIDVESVSGYFVENKNIGKIFVIEGVIRNTTGSPQNVSGVVGSVFDSKGAKLDSRPGSPGRIVSRDDLKNLPKDDIARVVRDNGETGGGVIPARASVPVMIIFTETPSGMAEYGIEVGR